MKKLLFISIVFVMASFSLQAKKYRLFYLGGQSNMDGFGYVAELPDDLKEVFDNVMIYHVQKTNDGEEANGKGMWAKLQPGYGTDFKFDGNKNIYGERFGLELTFAKRMQELFPGENIALVKYSKGGSAIDLGENKHGTWDPDYSEKNGVNQWDHFLATIRGAYGVDDIDGDGEKDQLIPTGILWMQGESDAHKALVASKYEKNLKRLIDMIRAALLKDDLPVVIGRISDSGQDEEDGLVWDFGNVVRAAQHRFVEKDPAAAIVTSTDNYGYSDKYHYDSEGYIDLGTRFAEEMAKLLKKCDI